MIHGQGPEAEFRESLGRLIVFLGLFLFIGFLVYTWPAGLCFVVGGIACFFLRGSKNEWAQAFRRTLLPLTTGFGLVSLLLLVLNLLHPTLGLEKVRTVEMLLVRLRMAVDAVNGPKFPVLIAVLVVLLMINHYLPKLKLVTWFGRGQQAVSAAFLFLVALTTFSLFSEKPLNGWMENAHRNAMNRYHLVVREEWEAVAQQAAGGAIADAVEHLDSRDKQYLQALFRQIQQTPIQPTPLINYPDYVARMLGQRRGAEAARQTGIAVWLEQLLDTESGEPVAADEIMERAPRSTEEWSRQQEILDAQEARTEKARHASDQSKAALDMALSAAVNLPLPEFAGVAGAYINAALEAASDPLAGLIERLWSTGRRHIEAGKRAFLRTGEPRAHDLARKFVLPDGPILDRAVQSTDGNISSGLMAAARAEVEIVILEHETGSDLPLAVIGIDMGRPGAGFGKGFEPIPDPMIEMMRRIRERDRAEGGLEIRPVYFPRTETDRPAARLIP